MNREQRLVGALMHRAWVPLSRCLPNQLQRVVWRWRQPHWSVRINAQEEHHVFVGWMDGHAIKAETPHQAETLVYVTDDDPRTGYPRVRELEWMELEEHCHVCDGSGGLDVAEDRQISCPACSGMPNSGLLASKPHRWPGL